MSDQSHVPIIHQCMLDVSQIFLDPNVRAREFDDQETVEEYAEVWKKGAIFPPIHVFFDGTVYRLVDGYHRLLAALQAGIKQISVIVHYGSARDAVLFAAKCNSDHGRRRTNGDKRFVVTRFLQDAEWQTKSARWIADTCLVSHTFVQNLRSEMATVASSAMVDSRDGKQRPATSSRTSCRERLPATLVSISVEQRQKLCTLWWDQLAKYVQLLSMAGWEPQKIADLLGMSIDEDVLPILNPSPQTRDVSEFSGIAERTELLAEAYKEVVEHHIHFLLELACQRAADVADKEGFPEIKAKLTERQHYHGAKASELKQYVCSPPCPEDYSAKFVAVQLCACMDARLALGIEKNADLIQEANQPLIERFRNHMQQIYITDLINHDTTKDVEDFK